MQPRSFFRYAPLMLAPLAMLTACGGGGGGVGSTPTPTPTPTPAPTPTPTPTPTPAPTPTPTNFNTQEYSNSNAAIFDKAITAWQGDATGSGVLVGVVDTGIDTTSAEFAGRISSASAAFGGNSSYQDEDGHGTAVTGILAAARNNSEIMGVAFDVGILTLRADTAGTCGATDGCTFSDSNIAQAIDRATNTGARVINLSLGGAGGASPQLQQAIDRATRAGVVIVVAAGNERDKADPEYDPSNPSPFATALQAAGNGLVIIATSVDANGQISAFSDLAGNSKDFVLSALGDRVRSLDLENDPAFYYVYSGTSFAAPQISGAAALLAQAFPNLSGAQIVQLLLNNATDAGAAGTDTIYGRGILNIAAAFSPVGTTSLGDSGIALSLTSNGTLSPAMGDAAGTAGTRTVAIDALGRAYAVAVQRSLSPGMPRAVLSPLRDGPVRAASFDSGRLSAAFSFADRLPALNRYGEPMIAVRPRDFAGGMTAHLASGTMLGLALDRPSDYFSETRGSGAFLAAREARESLGFQSDPGVAMMLRQRLAPRLHLTLSSENGEVQTSDTARPGDAGEWRRLRYQSFSTALDWKNGPLSLFLSTSLLHERDSLLGARLAPFFGIAGARTLFADANGTIALTDRWSLDLSARRGWTGAAGGGTAHLGTLAWSAGIGRTRILDVRDRLSLRIAQPLRVVSGGVDAMLPVEHDYASGRSQWRTTRVTLSPSGREIDTEMSYSRSFAGGWIGLNGYWRRQPGHIAWAADDFGGAIRFSVGY